MSRFYFYMEAGFSRTLNWEFAMNRFKKEVYDKIALFKALMVNSEYSVQVRIFLKIEHR